MGSSTAPLKTAIIVVTYQGRGYLADLFASLRLHTDMTSVAIVAVDNASSDGTFDELERVSAGMTNVHLIRLASNLGFTGGNNAGLRRARELGARYALLLNQDTVVTAKWLEPLEEVLDHRPEIAAAQPLLLLYDEPDRVNSSGNRLHFCGFGYSGGYRALRSSLDPDAAIRSVAFATGAALMLRIEALDRVGDLDDMLFLYHEDCDLQIRLRQAGYDCVLVPASTVLHKYTAGFTPRKYAMLDRNRWLVLLKTWPASRLLAAAPALVGVELAILAFAAARGWLPDKLRTYGEIARLLPRVLRERHRVQDQRSAAANDLGQLTGELEFEGFDHPIITRVANPVLSRYWSWVCGRFAVR
jgi:GT2 family glycosyltransferase